MRGTGYRAGRPRPAPRFIPTCAGNGLPSSMSLRQCAVHPHGYGEQVSAAEHRSRRVGSSPQVWGAGVKALANTGSIRSIPTGMGSGPDMAASLCGCPVHPHGCGEWCCSLLRASSCSGSSPRVRGAGRRASLRPFGSAVHPHVCGERRVFDFAVMVGAGSSPRMRGTVFKLRVVFR